MRTGRVLSATMSAGLIGLVGATTLPVRGHAAPACAPSASATRPTSATRPASAAPSASTAPSASAAPSVPAAEEPWPQRRTGLARLAGIADGSGVVVAVVDSGVDSAHPQLSGAVVAGLDLLDPGGDGRVDCVGHGTAVASIVAARPGGATPFRGVAPGATILPIRVSERIDGAGAGRAAPVSAVAAAVRQATDRGAHVINLALTVERDAPLLRDAVRYARSRDVLVIAAAGNRHDAGNPRAFPASYDGVLGVGAIQADGSRSAQSQTGDHLDLVAPGADVTAAARGGGHARYTGTSFATAFVAGAAALVRQYHPALTEAQVALRLITTADAAGGPGGDHGAGTVNPYRAVTASIDPDRAPPPTATVRSASAPTAAAAAGRAREGAYRLALGAAVTIALLLLLANAVRQYRTRQQSPAGDR